MIEGRDIICLANDWSGDPLSKKHLMRVLARKNRVLWINSVTNRTPKLNTQDARKIVRKVAEFARGSREVEPNVHVFTPLLFPFFHRPTLRWLNRRLLTLEIRAVLRRLRFSRPITWTFAPTSADLVGNLGEELVLYQCVDEFASFSDAPAATIRAMEDTLIAKADLVLASSQRLCERKGRTDKICHLVTHGVEAEHFRLAIDSSTTVPADLRAIQRPIVGFYGLIEDWIDLGLIRAIAEARPDWSVALIGSTKVDLSILAGLSNIHHLGRRSYDELPAYCKGFDAAIVPFVINELTLSANPLKFREYLAAGLPVVSTRLPEIERYQGLVQIADSPADFVRALEHAMANNDPDAQRRRVEAMMRETWTAKVEDISELIGRYGMGSGRRIGRRPVQEGRPALLTVDHGIIDRRVDAPQ